ncbi:MAG TPA: hypothetical protein VJP06_03385 [Thermoplasmata archaeon]|nr:hypothetical protein [Thermoplasmata archaeon]
MAGTPPVPPPVVPAPLPEPLRLPKGSVRGGIGILVTATYAYLLLQTRSVPTVVVNAVVVVIAFYFGTHVAGPPVPPGQPRPHGPRFVRVILVIGFLGLAAYFLRSNPSLAGLPPELVGVFEVLGGYMVGLTASWIVHRRAHVNPLRGKLATLFRDASALATIALVAYLCVSLATNRLSLFSDRAPDALSLVLTYYFGSRVIGH